MTYKSMPSEAEERTAFETVGLFLRNDPSRRWDEFDSARLYRLFSCGYADPGRVDKDYVAEVSRSHGFEDIPLRNFIRMYRNKAHCFVMMMSEESAI